MSVKRFNLSSAAFHIAAPNKSPVEASGAIAGRKEDGSKLLNPNKSLDQKRKSLKTLSDKSKKALTKKKVSKKPIIKKSFFSRFPIKSSLGGIAGLSFLCFGHGILGICAISYAAISGISRFNSD